MYADTTEDQTNVAKFLNHSDTKGQRQTTTPRLHPITRQAGNMAQMLSQVTLLMANLCAK